MTLDEALEAIAASSPSDWSCITHRNLGAHRRVPDEEVASHTAALTADLRITIRWGLGIESPYQPFDPPSYPAWYDAFDDEGDNWVYASAADVLAYGRLVHREIQLESIDGRFACPTGLLEGTATTPNRVTSFQDSFVQLTCALEGFKLAPLPPGLSIS